MPYNALETFKLLMFGGKKFNFKKMMFQVFVEKNLIDVVCCESIYV